MRAVDQRLGGVGTCRIVHCSRTDERGIVRDGPHAIELVTANTGPFENAQTRSAFVGRSRLSADVARSGWRRRRGKIGAVAMSRHALQVSRYRLDVRAGQMPKAIVDDFGHRAAGRTSVLGMTRRQITLELFVRPAADAPIMIRRDVVSLPALNERSAELALVVEAEHKIARRMSIAAMAERLDEISAAVPIRRLILTQPEAMRHRTTRDPTA